MTIFNGRRTVLVITDYADLNVGGSPMRTFIAAPKAEGKFPGIVFYSDIFQLTPTMVRACIRLAGYGFIVVAPEIYHRVEPPGAWIPFDDAGRDRGMRGAAQTRVAEFDADCRTVLDYLKRHPKVVPGKLGAGGFCIGGHLAFRAALEPDLKATVCFYGTGIHNGKLGRDDDAGSLERAKEISGELLMIFGSLDPHVPQEGRIRIGEELKKAGTKFSMQLFPAEHAFMRDEGPRFDPECTDLAWKEAIAFYRRVF
jgi:carboxymethylenebutenolidase